MKATNFFFLQQGLEIAIFQFLRVTKKKVVSIATHKHVLYFFKKHDLPIGKLYVAECWPVKTSYMQKMKVAKMKMLRWMREHTKRYMIQNKDIGDNVGVVWWTRCEKRG